MKRRAAIIIGLFCLVACDTGDGKTLREPTGTLPQTTVASTTTIPGDGFSTLPSVPLEAPVETPTLPAPVGSDFRLIAPWIDRGTIGDRHVCGGDSEPVSPALSWADLPEGTVELAVALVDDAANGAEPQVHWMIAGINPNDISLIEATVPLGAVQATNSFDTVGFAAPCPDEGSGPRDFRFTLYALSQQVELADGTPAADLLGFVQAVSISSADVVGIVER